MGDLWQIIILRHAKTYSPHFNSFYGVLVFAIDNSGFPINHSGFPINNPGEHSACQLTNRGYCYEEPAEGVLRILTYNIRNCIGMDGKTDFQRVADVIMAINPHVVALQEVDSVTRRMEGADVLRILVEKTGIYYRCGTAISFQGGKYGNGILILPGYMQSIREKRTGGIILPL